MTAVLAADELATGGEDFEAGVEADGELLAEEAGGEDKGEDFLLHLVGVTGGGAPCAPLRTTGGQVIGANTLDWLSFISTCPT